jgi:hypothetical protein
VCGGGLFVALAGELVSRCVAAGNFSHPGGVDSWHWSYVGQLERRAHTKRGD